MIQSGRLQVGKSTFIAFVDIEKAFDNVSWPKLFDILKIVAEIQGDRVEASIRKEERHGCSLSPPLFNLNSEEAINEIK